MKRLALLLTLAAACGGAGPKFTGNVRVADSRMVAINPDVKTLVDADQPVFFAHGSYWLFNDGQWFRADAVAASWHHVAKPPVPVLQIEQPYEYVHYRKTQPDKKLETVAINADSVETPVAEEPTRRPAKERQPAAVDPSIDPTVKLP